MQPAQMVNLQRGLNCQWVEPVAPLRGHFPERRIYNLL